MQAADDAARSVSEFYQRKLDEARTENQRLRDALDDFANPQHWAVTRDLQEEVPVWSGTYRKHPTEIARAALDGTPSAAQTLEEMTPTKGTES